MRKVKNLIVGLDPGTTVGYAAVDLSGNLVLQGSCRGLDRDRLVSLLNDAGDTLIVGTDKAKIPSFVGEVATRFGARIICPDRDLLIVEKRSLTVVGDNDHEIDALAAALFAFNRIRSLLVRVRKRAPLGLDEQVARLVFRDGLSVRAAVDLLTRPQILSDAVVDDVVEERRLEKRDFVKVWNELASSRRELELLSVQNRKLLNALNRLKADKKELQVLLDRRKVVSPVSVFKDRRIDDLRRSVEVLRSEQVAFKRKIDELEGVLARQDLVVLKRLPSLGFEDFSRLKGSLRVLQGDNLYVEDCNVHSAQVLDALRGVVGVVVSGKPVGRNLERRLPFIVVSASVLPVEHLDRFAVVPRHLLERAISGKRVLTDVVEEYKELRSRESS